MGQVDGRVVAKLRNQDDSCRQKTESCLSEIVLAHCKRNVKIGSGRSTAQQICRLRVGCRLEEM